MRALFRNSAVWLAAVACFGNDAAPFAGDWIFVPGESERAWLPHPPAERMRIDVAAGKVRAAGVVFTTDGRPTSVSLAGSSYSTAAKWEGAALIINSIVNGAHQYIQADRWRLSRDGNKLTIRRQISRGSNESESTLVYVREGAAAAEPVAAAAAARPASVASPSPSPAKPAPRRYVVEAGTKLPMRLLGSVNTKNAAEGDRVFLETTFPISANGRIVIPIGSQVNATLTAARRPGRVKGRAQLYLRFDSVTLPNGTTRDFRARLSGAEPGTGELDREEGGLKGDTDKSGDARKVGETAAAGAGVGAVVGSATGSGGLGTAVGAAAGAAAGLGRVFGSRGPDLNLPKGASMEMVTDRPLTFTEDELEGL